MWEVSRIHSMKMKMTNGGEWRNGRGKEERDEGTRTELIAVHTSKKVRSLNPRRSILYS